MSSHGATGRHHLINHIAKGKSIHAGLVGFEVSLSQSIWKDETAFITRAVLDSGRMEIRLLSRERTSLPNKGISRFDNASFIPSFPFSLLH